MKLVTQLSNIKPSEVVKLYLNIYKKFRVIFQKS